MNIRHSYSGMTSGRTLVLPLFLQKQRGKPMGAGLSVDYGKTNKGGRAFGSAAIYFFAQHKKNLTVNLVDTLYFKRNENFAAGGHGMEVLEQTHNLTKKYGRHKVVNNVNLSVNKGEIYGLIGKNGAGKTTALKLICGLANPTEGDICLFGQKGPETIYEQNRVGILIEKTGIYPNMSARDNIKLKCLAMGISSKNYIA